MPDEGNSFLAPVVGNPQLNVLRELFLQSMLWKRLQAFEARRGIAAAAPAVVVVMVVVAVAVAIPLAVAVAIVVLVNRRATLQHASRAGDERLQVRRVRLEPT